MRRTIGCSPQAVDRIWRETTDKPLRFVGSYHQRRQRRLVLSAEPPVDARDQRAGRDAMGRPGERRARRHRAGLPGARDGMHGQPECARARPAAPCRHAVTPPFRRRRHAGALRDRDRAAELGMVVFGGNARHTGIPLAPRSGERVARCEASSRERGRHVICGKTPLPLGPSALGTLSPQVRGEGIAPPAGRASLLRRRPTETSPRSPHRCCPGRFFRPQSTFRTPRTPCRARRKPCASPRRRGTSVRSNCARSSSGRDSRTDSRARRGNTRCSDRCARPPRRRSRERPERRPRRYAVSG